MAGGSSRGQSPARGPQPVTWVAMLHRTVCITSAVVVSATLVATSTVLLGDIQARGRAAVWVLAGCQVLQIVMFIRLARRRVSTSDIVVAVLLSSIALYSATTVTLTGHGALPVSEETARLLPSSAMHVQLIIAALFIRHRRWLLLTLVTTLVGTVWFTDPSGELGQSTISVDDRVMSIAYVVTAMILIRALRQAASDASALALRHREARAEVVAASNAQLADDEGRRIVHDRVISALSSAAAGRDADSVAAACEVALRDLDGLDPTRSAGDFREALLAKQNPRVILSGDGWPMTPPPRVIAALRNSAGEAIRNAGRHADVDEVSVVLSRSRAGQATVVIHDTGSGFDPAKTSGFGLSESIRARMGQVGGEVRIESAPGMGTTVRLIWPRRSRLAVAESAGVLAPERRSSLYVQMATPIVVALLFIALHHAPDSRSPAGSIVLAGLLCAALMACAHHVGRARLTWPWILRIAAFNAAVTALAVSLSGARVLTSLDAWPVIGGAFVVGALALAARVPQLAVAAAALTAVVAALAYRSPDVGVFEPVGALLMPVAYGTAGFTVGALLRRGALMVGIEEALLNAQADEEGWVESADAARRHYAEQLQAHVAPFLEYLVADKPKPSPAVQARATGLAAECRDLLAMSDPMPEPVRVAILQARTQGIRVAIRDAPSVSPVAWLMLSATLERATEADAITLIPARAKSPTRVTIIPRMTSRAEALVRDYLAGQTVWVEHTDVTTSFILVSPLWGATDA